MPYGETLFILGQITAAGNSLALGASACLAIAVGTFAWMLMGTAASERRSDFDYFETRRRQKLRDECWAYRTFEPLVDELASLNGNPRSQSARTLMGSLQLLEDSLPWRPNEFHAVRQLEGGLTGGVLGGIVGLIVNPVVGVVVFVICILFYTAAALAKVRDDANRHRMLIRKRLPYAIDLMALIMEAGAGFQESLKTIVDENQEHPLGKELGEVLSEVKLGRTRREALSKFQTRFNDPDIDEIVFSIVKGEELGTPLAEIFRTQAEQMRLKRSQWAEKAAGEAQVQIVFPGMIVMIACLLIVVAPFVLKVGNAL